MTQPTSREAVTTVLASCCANCVEIGANRPCGPDGWMALLLRAANVWKRCAQYLVFASCGKIHRDNRYVYMAHVCFHVCCSDSAGVCGKFVV